MPTQKLSSTTQTDSTPTKDASNTQSNANETLKPDYSKNTPLVEREPVDGTPFWIIKGEDGWHIFWGKYMLSEPLTKEAAIDRIERKDFGLIIMLIGCVFMEIEEIERNKWQQLKKGE